MAFDVHAGGTVTVWRGGCWRRTWSASRARPGFVVVGGVISIVALLIVAGIGLAHVARGSGRTTGGATQEHLL